LSLDSANSKALRAGLDLIKYPPMINSVSGERSRLEGVLALDDEGIPGTTDGRMRIVDRLMGLAIAGGLKEENLYVDPLVTAISTGTGNALITLETIRNIHSAYPHAHITSGLSNISFGMPLRPLINRIFMAMAVQAGLAR
jgi:5-methyltetrahydrofolate corrinoid/iron sulfur protein methyltransferase